jgi:uncharacterized protein YbjT (DUF2867 family)
MKILLTGATGFIGRNIATALVADGHQVQPASRQSGVDFRRMLDPQDWKSHLTGVDAVINAVGIISEQHGQRFESLHTRAPCALFHACLDAGIRRVIQISALGADEASVSRYHQSKRAADDELRRLDLDWFVLRPSLVYGRSGASTALFMRLAALPLIPVIGDGTQALQPVHVSDLVATVLRGLASSDVQRTLDVVGAERTTFADWLEIMRQAQGLPRTRQFHVPFSLVSVLAPVAGFFSPMLRKENLLMLQRGSVADSHPLTRFLGRQPLEIDPQLFFTADAPRGSAS